MNCIWILLLLLCCGNSGWGNNCGCSNNWNNGWNNGCNNGCGNNRCGDCRRNDYMDNCCSNGNGRCQRNERESTCENVCETVCEAACENAREEVTHDCGCRKNYTFTSFPVLDNCD